MTHPAVLIQRKTATLRTTFKKLEKSAKNNGHMRRMNLYHFMQTRLKRFANWFFTIWPEETQQLMLNDPEYIKPFARFQSEDAVLRWTKTPEWTNNIHRLHTGTQTTTGDSIR